MKSQQPVPYGFHLSLDIQLVCHEPVVPAAHGLFGRIVFRILIIGTDDPIQNPGHCFLPVMLVRNKHIRKHPVKPSALGVGTFVSWDFDPFVASVLIPDDAAAVIPEDKSAFPANRTKKFTVLR